MSIRNSISLWKGHAWPHKKITFAVRFTLIAAFLLENPLFIFWTYCTLAVYLSFCYVSLPFIKKFLQKAEDGLASRINSTKQDFTRSRCENFLSFRFEVPLLQMLFNKTWFSLFYEAHKCAKTSSQFWPHIRSIAWYEVKLPLATWKAVNTREKNATYNQKDRTCLKIATGLKLVPKIEFFLVFSSPK